MTDIRYADVIDLIRQRPPACGASTVVAIDGPSGAGKSAFADRVVRSLDAQLVRLDDLYRGWHDLAGTPTRVASNLLAPLSIGEVGRSPRWDWVQGRTAEDLVVYPGGTIVVDGVGAGSAPLRPFLSALIWLEAPSSVRKQRALSRDGDTYRPWWDVWAEQEKRHYLADPTRPHADVVVDTGA